MSYTRTKLKNDLEAQVSKSFNDNSANYIINNAVDEVVTDVDLRGTRRKTYIASGLFSDIVSYPAPTDLKERKIIDISKVNGQKGVNAYWTLVTPEEFSRYAPTNSRYNNDVDDFIYGPYYNYPYSASEGLYVSIDHQSGIKKLLLSLPTSDNLVTIDSLDSADDWSGFGDGENLLTDTQNYIKGSGSINFDINSDGGTTAGIERDDVTGFDITDYKNFGSVFVWVDLSSSTDITNFILRLGTNSSNYYYVTVTTTNEGTEFVDGWNLLRFDLKDKSETGGVTDTSINYAAVYMTKDAGKTDETDYRFDNILIGKGIAQEVIYYSKYPWVSSAGTRLQDSTDDTDILYVDREEYQLILEKSKQLMELHLLQDKRADTAEKRYGIKLANYLLSNPSEALLEINTIFNY